jgi:hypothetical protein
VGDASTAHACWQPTLGLPVERPSGADAAALRRRLFSTTRADTQHLFHDATRRLRS